MRRATRCSSSNASMPVPDRKPFRDGTGSKATAAAHWHGDVSFHRHRRQHQALGNPGQCNARGARSTRHVGEGCDRCNQRADLQEGRRFLLCSVSPRARRADCRARCAAGAVRRILAFRRSDQGTYRSAQRGGTASRRTPRAGPGEPLAAPERGFRAQLQKIRWVLFPWGLGS